MWTDDSLYLGESEFSSLSLIPENETDCYAFQRNPFVPDYLFIGFFCYICLPYICEYECNYFFKFRFFYYIYSQLLIENWHF